MNSWDTVLAKMRRAKLHYKPALLLGVLRMADEGEIHNGRIKFEDIESRFIELLDAAGLSEVDKAWEPFYFLWSGDRIWRLQRNGVAAEPPNPPRGRETLLRHADEAVLEPGLYNSILDPAGRTVVRENIYRMLSEDGDDACSALVAADRRLRLPAQATLSGLVPLDQHGNWLDAKFSVLAEGGVLSIILESRSGTKGSPQARNTDYLAALELILERLALGNFMVERVCLDPAGPRSGPLTPIFVDGHPYPWWMPEKDCQEVRIALGVAQGRTDRTPGARGPGNPTKRIRLLG